MRLSKTKRNKQYLGTFILQVLVMYMLNVMVSIIQHQEDAVLEPVPNHRHHLWLVGAKIFLKVLTLTIAIQYYTFSHCSLPSIPPED
jgi:hypothetical protein